MDSIGTIEREVIVGKHSSVWRELAKREDIARRFQILLSHDDLDDVKLRATDRVWILSYSKRADENAAMVYKLATLGAAEYVYVSTATTNVASRTKCYKYPIVKLLAENLAREALNAHVLSVGFLFFQISELPSGKMAATNYDDLASFMLTPRWATNKSQSVALFRIYDRPFKNAAERAIFNIYGHLISTLEKFPCALRPVDFALRRLGYKWYGYVYLSNKIWSMTTS
jgi:hypothetical protein